MKIAPKNNQGRMGNSGVGATVIAGLTTLTGNVDHKQIREGGGGRLGVPPKNRVVLAVLEVSFLSFFSYLYQQQLKDQT